MNHSDLEARLRSQLSDLLQHLTDDQLQQALSAGIETCGVTLPTSDPQKIEALLNRGEAYCLEALQNDWLPRFDVTYGDDGLSRSDVAKMIERKLSRLQTRWERLSKQYKPDADRSSTGVAVQTARRV
jgi:hypothetical protein